MEKICCKCKVQKDISEYVCKVGKKGKKWYNNKCRTCRNLDSREWALRNKDKALAKNKENYLKNKDYYKAYSKLYSKKYKASGKAGHSILKNRAKSKNWSFDLTVDDYIKITSEPCSYCNEAVSRGVGGIDRVDSSKGYTKDNSVSCCMKCNSGKGTMTVEEYVSHCKKVVQNFV
jgi:5-methylcytosine-specific restriction endonuclease McrA